MPESWFGHALTIVAMGGGTVGWFATVRFNRAAARSQHTFDVLLTTALDASYQRHLSAVRPYFVKPGDDGLPDLDKPEHSQLCESVVFLLNYYEFLAGAIRYGVLSEELVRDDQGFIIRQLFKHSETYIGKLRDLRKRPALFEQFEWLRDRWNGPTLPRMQRVVEWALTKPVYKPRAHP